MPGSLGGSYQSLSNDVYRSTTVAGSHAGVLDTVKKAFRVMSGQNKQTTDQRLIETKLPVVICRYGMK